MPEINKTEKKEKVKTNTPSGKNSINANAILIEPWVTETTTRLMEMNKYVFKVATDAKKKEVKQAVEKVFKVSVISVNTITIHRKSRTYGRTKGWKSGFKKAIITLKVGDKIELFEGA